MPPSLGAAAAHDQVAETGGRILSVENRDTDSKNGEGDIHR